MNKMEEVVSRLSIFKTFWNFMRVRKKWWLSPVLLVLILAAVLIVATEGTIFGPVIYALF